jgi:hypothetical protein
MNPVISVGLMIAFALAFFFLLVYWANRNLKPKK